jgi:uncharacterized delta-60 repeat protein
MILALFYKMPLLMEILLKKLIIIFLFLLPSLLQAQDSLIVTEKDTFSFGMHPLDVPDRYNASYMDGQKVVFAQGRDDICVVRRILSNGILDPTFASNGTKYFAAPPCNDTAVYYNGVTIDANHNIYLSGYKGSFYVVSKLKENGDEDLSFGNNGTLILGRDLNYLNEFDTKIKFDKKGNLLVLIDYWSLNSGIKTVEMFRLSVDGIVDNTFNISPKIHEKINDIQSGFPDFAVDGNNDIIVTGTGTIYAQGFVLKIKENAAYDNTFATTGIAYFGKGQYTYPSAIVVDSLNNIYIDGFYEDPNGRNFGIIAKLDNTGKFDATFGSNGVLSSSDETFFVDIAVYHGKIYTYGYTQYPLARGYYLDVRRLLPSGAYDPTFYNTSGIFPGVEVGEANLTGHFLQDQSMIVMSQSTEAYSILIHNIGYNGGYINTFGTNGLTYADENDGRYVYTSGSNGVITIDSYDDGLDEAITLKEDKNGNVFLIGSASDYSSTDFGIIKLLPNGNIDKTFGKSGKLSVSIDPYDYLNDVPYSASVRDNGDLYISGITSGNGYYLSVLSIHNDGTLNSSYGNAGIVKQLVNYTNTTSDIFSVGDKIVCAVNTTINNPNYALVRLDNTGQFDVSFNKTGKFQSNVYNEFSRAVVADSIGNTYVSVSQNLSGAYPAILKFKENGTVDSSFAKNGVFNQANPTIASILRLTRKGDLLVANKINASTAFNLLKIRKSGALDSSFALNGSFTFNANLGITDIKDVYEHTDSSIYIILQTNCSSLIMHLLPNGKIDNSFSTNGIQDLGNVVLNKFFVKTNKEVYLIGRDAFNFLLLRVGITPINTGNTGGVTTGIQSKKESSPYQIRNNVVDFFENGEVTIYDFTGRLVYQKSVDHSTSIKLNEGYYILKFFSSNGGTYSNKIAVTKD